MVTNWYPTKENPYMGLFFKEQAFVVSEKYDFLIIHYKEKFKKIPGRKFCVEQINKESNTIEYNINVNVPITIYLSDIFHNFKIKHISKKTIDGVGYYVSKQRINFTKNILKKVFNTYFQGKFDALYCVDAQNEAVYLEYISEITGKPYMISEHAPVPWPGSVIKDVNKYAMEKADLFMAISYDKIRQLLLQNIKLPDILYIGNFIDETMLKINYNHKSNNIKTFIIVAANSYYKNYDLFIKIMNTLTDITLEKFKVMIVGYAANKGYSKNVNELENKIKYSKFAKYAELIPEVPHNKIGYI